MTFDRISVNPDMMGGLPCLKGVAIPVASVAAMVSMGMTVEDILDEMPGITTEDVSQALQYAALAARERAHSF